MKVSRRVLLLGRYKAVQMNFEVGEEIQTTVDLDQASTILMVREMLCIVVYLILAVHLENCSVACFLLASLD